MNPVHLRRWARRLWPALAVLVGYYVLLGSGRQALHEQYTTRVEDWARRGVTTERLDQQDQQRSALTRKVQDLTRQRREAEQALTGSALFFLAPDYANQVSERLSALLVDKGLRIREVRELDPGSGDVTPSRLARDLKGWYRSRPADRKGHPPAVPRPWVILLEGDYPAMRRALAAMEADPLTILPFALAMEQEDAGGWVWTLGVWL